MTLHTTAQPTARPTGSCQDDPAWQEARQQVGNAEWMIHNAHTGHMPQWEVIYRERLDQAVDQMHEIEATYATPA